MTAASGLSVCCFLVYAGSEQDVLYDFFLPLPSACFSGTRLFSVKPQACPFPPGAPRYHQDARRKTDTPEVPPGC